jgi:hypothetical protein
VRKEDTSPARRQERETVVFTLYTLHRLSEKEAARRLWTVLDVPLIRPARYDSVERARKPFAPDAYEDGAALYGDEGMLFVRGREDGFLAFFSREPRGLSVWRVFLNARALEGAKLERWLVWVFTLCETFPLLYGYGCSTAEYEAKHVAVRHLPGGGRIRQTLGVSTQEFFQYLPGVYWLNLFGRELNRAFRSRYPLLGEPVAVRELAHDQAAVYLRQPVLAEDMEERLRMERRIADVLGAPFFFDRARMDELAFQSVPPLAEVLEGGQYA